MTPHIYCPLCLHGVHRKNFSFTFIYFVRFISFLFFERGLDLLKIKIFCHNFYSTKALYSLRVCHIIYHNLSFHSLLKICKISPVVHRHKKNIQMASIILVVVTTKASRVEYRKDGPMAMLVVKTLNPINFDKGEPSK